MPGVERFINRKKAALSQDGTAAAAASAVEQPNPAEPSTADGGAAPLMLPAAPKHDVPGGDAAAADSFAPFGAGDRPDTSGSNGFSSIFGGGHDLYDGGVGFAGGPPEEPNPFIADDGAGGNGPMFNFESGSMGEMQEENGEIGGFV